MNQPGTSSRAADAANIHAGRPRDSAAAGTVAAPSIVLPKGGGAIRGMGEKFTANPVTGTGSMTVPIATPPGRSGFGPELTLSYDSGAGNGPFGLGWGVPLPAITRKTDKGLPRYLDRDDSDVFILSGAEDLVPEYEQGSDGQWVLVDGKPVVHERQRTIDVDGATQTFAVRRYRPRLEGSFGRIERWIRSDGDEHWRSISRDNVLTVFGSDPRSRIADPADSRRTFSWHISEARDDKGNAVLYEYKPEDGNGVDLTHTHERNRGEPNDSRRATNRYLKRIQYGNRATLLDATGRRPVVLSAAQRSSAKWMFEVVFDYGEHDDGAPTPDDAGPWAYRRDSFSTYRAGFEVRTSRLCRRVLVFHHFDGEPDVGADCLARSTDFTYSQPPDALDPTKPAYTFLVAVAQCGYKRSGSGYRKRTLPPVEFQYTQPVIQSAVHEVDAASVENAPAGVDGTTYHWTDLHGEGIPGILSEQAGAWFYKRNISPCSERPVDFAPQERVAVRPNLALVGEQAQFMDLAGDGQLDLVVLDGPTPGLYEHDTDEGWRPFRPFSSRLNRTMRGPDVKLVDLDGDGHADVLISDDGYFVWHSSLAEDGFGPARRVAQERDEEKGPRLTFRDGGSDQSIHLADLSGDGLTDLVRVRNGEICYWPSLGHGRFGAKVTMDNSPRMDDQDQFDHDRIRLADVDGTGTTDLIYLHRDGVRVYFNQSGNGWSDAQYLDVVPRSDDLVSIVPTDLFGNGTACLVWSSPLAGDSRRPMRYVDLMGGQKPHLMAKTVNNLGAETSVEYAPSTRFYLADKATGQPWITKLPFPVHCVQRVTVTDKWRQTGFSATYSYHHGYFDGAEREFRGFGRVEQTDVESYGEFAQGNSASPYITSDRTLYQPPVKTVTWYHTGAPVDKALVLSQLADDYFPRWFENLRPDAVNLLGNFHEHALPEPRLDTLGLDPEERREALRACRGIMLRQEIYELDVDELERGEHRPTKVFSTAYHNGLIRRLQPKLNNRHAVFVVAESEAITYHYELDLRAATLRPDPRIVHTLNLQIDQYANPLQSVTVVYPRLDQFNDEALPADAVALIQRIQRECHLAYTETRYTDDVLRPDSYRLRAPCEVLTYELTGIGPEDADDLLTPDARENRYFTLDELRRFRLSQIHQVDGEAVPEIPYHVLADATHPQRRVVEHTRMLYFEDGAGQVDSALPLGQLGELGLPYETYKLALTDELLEAVFADKLTSEVRDTLDDASVSGYLGGPSLAARFPGGGTDGEYWLRSGITGFSPDAARHFFLPERFIDPFGNVTTIEYDRLDLFVESVTDSLGNTSRVERFDFRVLAPAEVRDINDNLSGALFDVLGLPTAMAVRGKGEEGDTLAGLDDALANPDIQELAGFFDQTYLNETQARAWLADATARHVYYFGETRNANGAVTWGVHPASAGGLVREVHSSQLAPGEQSPVQASFEYSDGTGSVLVKKVQAEPEAVGQPLRWVASGKAIVNNKGLPVKQYEPYFSAAGHRFEEPAEAGVTSVVYYDALGRIVRTEMPDGTFSRVEFSPWLVRTFDPNDTVTDSQWYADRDPPDPALPLPRDLMGRLLVTDEQRAAWLAAHHANTPTLTVLDSLGREAIGLAHNRIKDPAGPHTFAGERWADDYQLTAIRLDAEGKPLSLRDARGNLVMQYLTPPIPDGQPDDPVAGFVPCYDLAGNVLFQHGMDNGERWMLNDAAGKPMLVWDGRGRTFRTEYDGLQRPVASFATGADQQDANRRILCEKIIYGDAPGNGLPELRRATLNLRGKEYQHHDSAGVITSVARNPHSGADEAYDFKGNLLRSARQLVQDYKSVPDWLHNPALETETYTAATRYNALNRPIQMIAPHGDGPGTLLSVVRPGYNEAGLLERTDLWLQQTDEPAALLDPTTATHHVVTDIDYDARGERTTIHYGNGVITTYEYDPQTLRLVRLLTDRGTGFASDWPQPADPPRGGVQNLAYSYDPHGNITTIRDHAQQMIFFNGQMVEPTTHYEYDATYRLVAAAGREHVGQQASHQVDHDDSARMNQPLPTESSAVRNYTERYEYDRAGNIRSVIHQAGADGTWMRRYDYEASSNRLRATSLPGDGPGIFSGSYQYDAHGNMTRMPHLPVMRWDLRDQIQATAKQVVNAGVPETTWCVYGADGQRVRKVTDRQAAPGATPVRMRERLYLGGFEVYREYGNDGNAVTLERQTLHVTDDKQRVALVETKTTDPAAPATTGSPRIRYQFENHLGSAALELDHAGQVISYEEFYPFGSTSFQVVRSGIEVSAKRYRYTGMERDEETGLCYHSARFYAPWLGRWTSCDPAGTADGLNSYTMVRNNPITRIDVSGMDSSETTYVSPAVKGYLDKHNIKYATEVCFDLIRPDGSPVLNIHGNPIKGRFDVVFRDPRAGGGGPLMIPELKGKNLDKLHGNQHDYVPQLESNQGARIKITSYRTSAIGIKFGDNFDISAGNYLRVGTPNLDEFANALSTLTGGRKIAHTFISATGEAHFFYSTEEYHAFLAKDKSMQPTQKIKQDDPPISKRANPTRPPRVELPKATLLSKEASWASKWTKFKFGATIGANALKFAGGVLTVYNVAQCFGSNPHLGSTAGCVQFELTDFVTFGLMSAAEYGMTEFVNTASQVPEFRQTIERATGIEEMNRKMDEMYMWTDMSRKTPARR